MTPLRVLVVDDSAANRHVLTHVLHGMDGIEVVGKAPDGASALKSVDLVKPDLITLDLEMPNMDGFTFLRLLMARRPTPVIVISSNSGRDSVFRALEQGALDFVAKPSNLADIAEALVEKIQIVRQLAPTAIKDHHARSIAPRARAQPPAPPKPTPQNDLERLVVIAASTGGPSALANIFRHLPSSTNAAFVVAQHMPPRFTTTFAARLDKIGKLRVREASSRHRLKRNEVWVCPGGMCVEVLPSKEIVVVKPRPDERHKPSADRVLLSAARHFGDRTVGVVLTGMGADGARGAVAVKEAGGVVFAESEETAVVYGMPDAAVRAGGVTDSFPLPRLTYRLSQLVRAGR